MQDIMHFASDHAMLVIAWMFLLVIVIFTMIKNVFCKINEISNIEAIRLINKEDSLIIDLRNRDTYRKGHIINAINFSVSDIKSNRLGELYRYKNKPIIMVCDNGIKSTNQIHELDKAGFKKVYVLKEGIKGWTRENLPLIKNK